MHDENRSARTAPTGISGAPQTRQELEDFMSRSPETGATVLARQWLTLDTEYTKLRQQLDHVNSTFPDELLSALLKAQTGSLLQAIRRRADDLAALPADHIVDTCCKCFVRKRLIDIDPDETLTPRRLLKSILSDLDHFGIDPASTKAKCA